MDKLNAWWRWWKEKARTVVFLVCFHFSSMKENDIQAAMDGAQILVGEIVRECLAALKCVQAQMHYI